MYIVGRRHVKGRMKARIEPGQKEKTSAVSPAVRRKTETPGGAI